MQIKAQDYKALVIGNLGKLFSNDYFPYRAFVLKTVARLEKLIEEASQSATVLEEPLEKDLWGFDFFWPDVQDYFGTVEKLYAALHELHQKIAAIKERFRSQAEIFPPSTIVPNLDHGISSSYFLIDEKGERRYVVKPVDEDAGCINNDHGFATPYDVSPIRAYLPLYKSAMREVLAYRMAVHLGVAQIVPKTSLAILKSDQFHDFLEGVSAEERKRYLELCGEPDLEKLCSIQEYVPNAKSLFEALQDFQMAGLTDAEIAARFDQTDFEDANILLWTTYDTDGHMGNFLVVPKGTDAIGNQMLGLKKIDNGLAFPDKNVQLRNNLAYMPNAQRPLSEQAKAKIAEIDVDRLAKEFEAMGLETAIPALYERMAALKNLAKEPGITIKQINKIMTKIGKKP